MFELIFLITRIWIKNLVEDHRKGHQFDIPTCFILIQSKKLQLKRKLCIPSFLRVIGLVQSTAIIRSIIELEIPGQASTKRCRSRVGQPCSNQMQLIQYTVNSKSKNVCLSSNGFNRV